MKNSGYPNEALKKQLVHGFHISDKSEEVIDYKISKDRIPAAGLISTAADLVLWNNALHGGKLLKAESYAKMISPDALSQHSLFGNEAIGYGFGIRINHKAKTLEYGHTGIVQEQGFTSINLFYPKTKTSIIVLENQCFDNFAISYFFESEIRKLVLASGILE
jgi:D-alanyl-D-alanine carboxypeptidase